MHLLGFMVTGCTCHISVEPVEMVMPFIACTWIMDSTAAMLFQPQRLRALECRHDALLKADLQVR